MHLEKAMAPHSSTLAWKIPWMEEPGGLQSMGSPRVGHDWATSLSLFTFMHWRRKWQPNQCSFWRIPGTGKPGGLPSMGSHRVRQDWSNLAVAVAAEKESVQMGKQSSKDAFRKETFPGRKYQVLAKTWSNQNILMSCWMLKWCNWLGKRFGTTS